MYARHFVKVCAFPSSSTYPKTQPTQKRQRRKRTLGVSATKLGGPHANRQGVSSRNRVFPPLSALCKGKLKKETSKLLLTVHRDQGYSVCHRCSHEPFMPLDQGEFFPGFSVQENFTNPSWSLRPTRSIEIYNNGGESKRAQQVKRNVDVCR